MKSSPPVEFEFWIVFIGIPTNLLLCLWLWGNFPHWQTVRASHTRFLDTAWSLPILGGENLSWLLHLSRSIQKVRHTASNQFLPYPYADQKPASTWWRLKETTAEQNHICKVNCKPTITACRYAVTLDSQTCSCSPALEIATMQWYASTTLFKLRRVGLISTTEKVCPICPPACAQYHRDKA